MTQTHLATGLLLPADANQPVQHIQVWPGDTRAMVKLIGCQWIELVRTPIENVAMIINEEGLLEDKRLNMLASTLLLGLEGPATTALTEQALAVLAEFFDIEPGRSAIDVARARLAETDGGAA